MRRTALFICGCGSSIREALDLEELARWARRRGDLQAVVTHDLLCTPQGKEDFKAALAGPDFEAVVVAGCSPRMHGKTFEDLVQEVGLNTGRVLLANIREQCAWVTRDPDEAQAKARALVSAAIQRAQLAEDLPRRSIPARTDLLVIGGGVAGMEAAIVAANAGRQVTIVEREISLGGAVIRVEEVAPTMECSSCLLAPRLDLVQEHPKIDVIANAEVIECKGFMGNFTVQVRQRARYVEHSCIACEACYEVCPVELESPFYLGLGQWKAVHALFPGAVPAAAVIEPEHCLQLNGGSCDACAPACPFGSINFEQRDQQHELKVGAVVLATGSCCGDLSGMAGLGYGALESVYSMMEFERLASNNGPTGGKILLRHGRAPRSAAVIHCAGSLRDDGLPYCSGVCCANAVKVGSLLRAQIPDAEVTNVHHDLVLSGPRERRLHSAAVAGGTRFVACDDLTAVQIEDVGGDRARVSGPGFEPLEVELVVLSNGMAPAIGTAELAAMMALELDQERFFKSDHELLHATGAARDGIYLAGAAAGPCGVAEAITRARAAAGDAISKLVPGREIALEVLTSSIDERRCAGCKLCLAACPYKAIDHHQEQGICSVNEAICRGCGSCAAACASGACRARHFTDEQLLAEIGAVLDD